MVDKKTKPKIKNLTRRAAGKFDVFGPREVVSG